jgi:hypothetical protein
MHTDRVDSLTCWINADRSKYSMPLFSDLLDTYRQVRHTDTHFPDLLDKHRQVRRTYSTFVKLFWGKKKQKSLKNSSCFRKE